MANITDRLGTTSEQLNFIEIRETNSTIVEEKVTDLNSKSDPLECNSTGVQETKSRKENSTDKIENEEQSDSHQRQTEKCCSCKEYSLLLPCHMTGSDRVFI